MSKLITALAICFSLTLSALMFSSPVYADYCSGVYQCCTQITYYECHGTTNACDPSSVGSCGYNRSCTCNTSGGSGTGNCTSNSNNGDICSATINGAVYSGSCSCTSTPISCDSLSQPAYSGCTTSNRCGSAITQPDCAELSSHTYCTNSSGTNQTIFCNWTYTCTWGAWSACTKSCGGGTTTRTDGCGDTQTVACNTQACPVTCGNGICEAGESCGGAYYCPQDCGACPGTCGNGVCDSGENSTNCCQDCGGCAPPPSPPACTPNCTPACGQADGCGGTCSNTASTTPTAPGNLTPANGGVVTPSNNQVTVTWSAATNATSYYVEIYPTGTPAGQECTVANSYCSATSLTSFTTTLTGNVSNYTWRVQGVNGTCSNNITSGPFSTATNFTIAGPITGTIYIDNGNNATINGVTGLCSGSGAGSGAGLASNIYAQWGGGNTTNATISGQTYTISNVGFDVNTSVTLTPGSGQYECSCPVGCSYSGLSAPRSGVDFYLSNTRTAWWQTQNGNIYAGASSGNAMVSLIPSTCTTPNCTPALSLLDNSSTTNSYGYAVTGGGIVDSTADPTTTTTYLNAAGTSERVIGATLRGPHEDYSYFSELFGMGSTPTADFTGTQPTSAPTNGRAYYASSDVTISSAWSVLPGQSYVIFVNGNLNVNSTITVANGGFLAFIVKGNISFANTLSSFTTNNTSSLTATDVAVGKSAVQSSNLTGCSAPNGCVAGDAVDGNTDGVWADGSVSHTNSDVNAWWQVDLGASYNISSINIYNRTDCCGTRLTNYYLFVSDNPFTSTDPTATVNQSGVSNWFFSATAGSPTTQTIGRTGRYVRIQLNHQDYLAIAELQVMGTPVPVTATNPVSWWKFDECSGTALTDSAGSNNATLNIGAGGSQTTAGTCSTANTAWGNGATGVYGASLKFDGTDDYANVTAPSGMPSGTTPRSISMWVKPTNVNPGGTLFAENATSGQSFILMMTNLSGTQYVFTDGVNASNNVTATGSQILTAGVWNHVVFTVDPSTNIYNYYINGTLVKQGAFSVGINTSLNNITIGKRNDGANAGNYFPGQIDDVRVFNYVLSPSQVAALYTTSSTTSPIAGVYVANGQIIVKGGLVGGDQQFVGEGTFVGWGGVQLQRQLSNIQPLGRWTLNECTGTTVKDTGIAGDNGTLTVGAGGTQTAAGTCTTAGTAWGNGYTSGLYNGPTLNLDGTDDYVTIPNNSNFNFDRTSSFSLAFWARSKNSTTGSIILAKMANVAPYTGWNVGVNIDQNGNTASGKILLSLINSCCTNTTALTAATTNATKINDGGWHHYVITYNGTSTPTGIQMYEDGNSVTTSGGTGGLNNLTGPMTNSEPITIGGRTGGQVPYTGQVADVRIFNTALTPTQVTQIYKDIYPVAAWTFNEGSGTTTSNTYNDTNGSAVTATFAGTNDTWGVGISGTALTNSGGGAGASFTYPAGSFMDLPANAPLAVAFWLKSSTSHTSRLIEAPTSGGLAVEYIGTSLRLASFGGNVASATTMVFDGNWHYYVVSYDGTTASFYRDGSLIGSQALAANWTQGSKTMYLGGDAAFPLNGSLDNVQIYRVPLSASSVSLLYQNSAVTTANNNTPSEVFKFRPDFMLNLPSQMAQPITIWQETN